MEKRKGDPSPNSHILYNSLEVNVKSKYKKQNKEFRRKDNLHDLEVGKLL